MFDFHYRALPWNVRFRTGIYAELPALLKDLGLGRALVLSTPEQEAMAQSTSALLAGLCRGTFVEARMHVPIATVKAAEALAQKVNADCTVSIGGGSTTGLGKALAVRQGLDNVAIPTTYAGSEMTDIWAVTESDRKVTKRDVRAVPTLTIYDPELSKSLPATFAAVSGINALAQAVVNVATDSPNPFVTNLAIDGIRALSKALPKIIDTPDDMEARSLALYGASMAGAALGTGKTGIHHKLCHIFGGMFNTPHAETHAILLPYSVAFNAQATTEGTRQVAEAMNVADAALGIYELGREVGAPAALSDIGIREEDLDRAAERTIESEFANPAAVTLEGVRELLRAAFEGKPPR